MNEISASQTLRKCGKATPSRFDWGLFPQEELTLGIINQVKSPQLGRSEFQEDTSKHERCSAK